MIAARLFAQGKSLTEVAATVGSSKSSASRWKQAWEQGGAEALHKPHPGADPKLKPQQQRRLLAALKQGPRRFGYAPPAGPARWCGT